MSVEKPTPFHSSEAQFGSDVIAETLRDAGIPYIALNPGASFRGLHDSLVNYLGNERPSMLLCLHEEHAVAIAHGYAKVTGRTMAAAVHSNVGLFHATMAMFNAWCDRMPVVVVGATGPVDAAKRRPWIDWIHTARDQGAIVRPYVKWDDQPASVAAARESVVRAIQVAQTYPQGPVYVNFDSEVQETRLGEALPSLNLARMMPSVANGPCVEAVSKAVAALEGAERPVVMIGRVSRDASAWKDRIALAEALGAKVVTDLKVAAAFPTEHPLHVGTPAYFADAATMAALRDADVILSLDWVDLAGTMKMSIGDAEYPTVIHASLDHVLHNGWSMDHQALPLVDVAFACSPDSAVASILKKLKKTSSASHAMEAAPIPDVELSGPISVDGLGIALRHASQGHPVSLLHVPLSWNAAIWPLRGPYDFLGSDGGGGIGGGPGIAVGSALALRDCLPEMLPIAICGDGDFIMGATAIWTAVHYRVPLLVLVANNQSFYNDELHQERVARIRGRPVENKWIGQRMIDPEINIGELASAQGAVAFGPVHDGAELNDVFRRAIAEVRSGRVAVVDVRVRPGYNPNMASALTRDGK